MKLLDISRVDDMLKSFMEVHGRSKADAIIWMKELGYDVSFLEEEY